MSWPQPLLDQQGFGNIDIDNFAGVGELCYEQRLPGEHARIKAGRVDANVDFASNEHAADFLNSSMGFSPTIFMMPTYPHPTVGGNVSAAAGPSIDVCQAVVDTNILRVDGSRSLRRSRPTSIGLSPQPREPVGGPDALGHR